MKFQSIKKNVVTDIEHLYNASASSTYQETSAKFFLGYEGGSNGGVIAIETVSVMKILIFTNIFTLRNLCFKVKG